MKNYNAVDTIWLFEQLTLFLGDNRKRDYGTGTLYTTVEVHTVSFIGNHPGITSSELAKMTGKTKGAVSQVLKKLYMRQLIYRENDAQDAKKQHIFLTEKGTELKMAHREYDVKNGTSWFDFIMQGTSELERDYTLNVLERWIERMALYCDEN